MQTAQPVRQANYYGSPAYDYDRAEQNSRSGAGRARRGAAGRLLANQTRYNRTHRDAVISAIQNLAAYVPATGLVTISRQGNERENEIVSNQTTFVDRFATGRLRHGFSGGVEVLHENQFAPTLQGLGTRAPVNIYSPNPSDPITGYAPSRSLAETDGTTNSAAVYANDAVELGQRWLVSGGFRLERYQTDYRAVDALGVTTTDLTADGNLFSGRGQRAVPREQPGQRLRVVRHHDDAARRGQLPVERRRQQRQQPEPRSAGVRELRGGLQGGPRRRPPVAERRGVPDPQQERHLHGGCGRGAARSSTRTTTSW